MKKFALVVTVLGLALVAGLLLSGCGKKEEEVTMPKAGLPESMGDVKIAQTMCPVMEGPIDKQYYADYKGRRIYFCCSGCVNTFKKEPEKYMKKLDEMKKSGTTTSP